MRALDAKSLDYKELNIKIKSYLSSGIKELVLDNVNGQRFIGDGLKGNGKIIINGIPGSDLAAFMDGPTIEVHGNAQDGVGNTMNAGTIIIYGDSRDTLGYSMRGGELYIQGDVGYRVGIHMKGYLAKQPVIVVGGKAGDFFAEYMAGGIQIVLGLNLKQEEKLVGNYCGAGMHGGVIYLRGDVDPAQLGKEVKKMAVTEEDLNIINKYVVNFAEYFKMDREKIMSKSFIKLIPYNKRPYGNLYAKW